MSDPWDDSLSEDWISQPRDSPVNAPTAPGTMRGSLSAAGTTRILHESISTTNRRPDTAGTEIIRASETPEWKRMVMEDFGAPGGKDLFSPMQLECMFRPPTIGPSSAPALAMTRREESPRKQRQEQRGTPVSKYKSNIPLPTSSPRPLREERKLLFSPSHHRGKSLASSSPAPPRQLSKLRQSLGHRKSSSASSVDSLQSRAETKGKRKAERYADTDNDTNSIIMLAETQSQQSDTLRMNENWSSIRVPGLGNHRSTSEQMRRDEDISSIIVDRLRLLKEPGMMDTTQETIGSALAAHDSQYLPNGLMDDRDSEADDIVGEMISAPPTGPRRRKSLLSQDGESSVYPSSPPVFGHSLSGGSQLGDNDSYPDGEEDDYDASYLDGSLDKSSSDLGSPFTSPPKQATPNGPSSLAQKMLASPFLPAGQEPRSVSPSKRPAPLLPPQGELPGAGNSILDNIRRHKDAPKSPLKSPAKTPSRTNRNESESPDEREDPFFTPHAFRHQIHHMSPRTSPLKVGEETKTSIQVNRSSGSPLKLFASFYDTYTNERLTRRLGELETSVHEEHSNSLKVPGKDDDYESEQQEEETDISFSGGSIVVNRLEKMARKQEKAKSPSRHLKPKSRGALTSTTRPAAARPTSAHRHASAPEASPRRSLAEGYRKHRRWRSDESGIGDGVEAPKSPLKERTPKRLRRNTNGVYNHRGSSFKTDEAPPPVPDLGSMRKHANRVKSDSVVESAPRTPVSKVTRRVTDGGTPTSASRKKERKVPVLKKNYDYGDPVEGMSPKPGISPRKGEVLVFSGSRGDGMEGEGFEMPSPMQPETVRKGSVTTQDFLDQADAVMNRIRDRGLRSVALDFQSPGSQYSIREDGSYYDDLSMRTLPRRDEDGNVPVLPSSPLRNEIERQLPNIRVTKHSSSMISSREGSFDGKQDTVKTHASSSSHKSRASAVEVISPGDGVMDHHLARKNNGTMTFDEEKMTWVKRDQRERSLSPEKESSQLLKIEDSDPFIGISDLSVDSQEEARALELARRNWEGMASDGEKSGLWRSSRMIGIDEEDEEDGIGDETWDRQQWFEDEVVDREHSTVGSGSSERSSRCTRPDSGAETRTTSYGSDENKDKVESNSAPAAGEDSDDSEVEEIGRGDIKSSEPLRRARNSYAEDYSSPTAASILRQDSSSPGDLPLLWTDEGDTTDGGIDGFLEHGALRQPRRNASRTFSSGGTYRGAARRRSGGTKSFIGRPISRITEEEEDDHAAGVIASPAMQDIQRELSRISLSSALTPLPSPFMSRVNSMSGTRKVSDVSFQMTPLTDLSYQFETTEALINLELSFFATRQGRAATAKSLEVSFTIARDNLLKSLTDVEPYEPYWDHMNVLKLSDRKIETLFTLNDWCPRLEELDVSNNELGQLSGVSESVRDLKVGGNCLSGITHWGHLVNLQYLDVSRNGLENLDGLRGLRHLREIKADDNLIENIDGVLGMDGLGVLRARRNRLVTVSFEKAAMYVGIPSVHVFRLRTNGGWTGIGSRSWI